MGRGGMFRVRGRCLGERERGGKKVGEACISIWMGWYENGLEF